MMEKSPIFEASQQGSVETVTYLLQYGADPKEIHEQFLPFLVQNRHFALARSLIQREAPIFGISEPQQQNLLHLLCINTHLNREDKLSFIELVCARSKLSILQQARDAAGRLPIFYAVEHCNIAVINILLKYDLGSMTGFLETAEKFKRYDAIHLILDHMALHHRRRFRVPICIEFHFYLTLRCLLERGEYVDTLSDEDNGTALYTASNVVSPRTEILHLLLNHDANINYFNKRGFFATSKKDYPLHVACASGNEAVVLILLAAEADYCVLDHRHRSSLHLATSGCNLFVIRQIIERGVDLEIHDDHGRSAYHYACDRRRTEAAELLFEYGAEISYPV